MTVCLYVHRCLYTYGSIYIYTVCWHLCGDELDGGVCVYAVYVCVGCVRVCLFPCVCVCSICTFAFADIYNVGIPLVNTCLTTKRSVE